MDECAVLMLFCYCFLSLLSAFLCFFMFFIKNNTAGL